MKKEEQDKTITGELLEDDNLREAKTFLGLMEALDITSGNMESSLINEKEKIMEEITPDILEDVELNTSLIDSNELLSDFVMIREALRDDIKTTRTILNTLGIDIAASHADDLSGSLIMAFAELKKGNVASIKMLMDSYSSVGETQLKIKKLITEIKDIENGEVERKEGSTQNIINFVGTPAELLANLKTN